MKKSDSCHIIDYPVSCHAYSPQRALQIVSSALKFQMLNCPDQETGRLHEPRSQKEFFSCAPLAGFSFLFLFTEPGSCS